jgi:hypothetical protein
MEPFMEVQLAVFVLSVFEKSQSARKTSDNCGEQDSHTL